MQRWFWHKLIRIRFLKRVYRKFLIVLSTKANRNIWKPVCCGGIQDIDTKASPGCQPPLFMKPYKITAIPAFAETGFGQNSPFDLDLSAWCIIAEVIWVGLNQGYFVFSLDKYTL